MLYLKISVRKFILSVENPSVRCTLAHIVKRSFYSKNMTSLPLNLQVRCSTHRLSNHLERM